ncbi:neuronal acetylcholine receptor subunit alpha-4-like isoform X2 [Symsagittifera roscoffensis]|uniref:neuronal acetylcholine receptor subunit alpha-4-like isoform X2 n=1 Tax=Symsagittifera roscoffensis TaxID=84072 RepID=UPI00307BAAD8
MRLSSGPVTSDRTVAITIFLVGLVYLCTPVESSEKSSNLARLEKRAEVQGNANRLIDYLFNNYTTLIRPRINQSDNVRVQFDIAMKQVIDVDVKTQQMTLFLWQRQTWVDDFLAWNPADFGGIDQLFISPTKIWRKPEFFEKNLIVPTALICALSIVAFLLPNESGEKIGFSITVFLSLCVNLVVITSYVPASSESFPIIGQYYLTCIFLVAVSIVLTTCILSVHYFGDQYFIKPLPKPIKKVFFEVLGPLVGMQCLKLWSSCVPPASSVLPAGSKRKTPININLTQTWKNHKSQTNSKTGMQRKNNGRVPSFSGGGARAKNSATVLRNSKVSSTTNHFDPLLQLNSTSFYSENKYPTTRSNPYTSSPDKRSGSASHDMISHVDPQTPESNHQPPKQNKLTNSCNHSSSAMYISSSNSKNAHSTAPFLDGAENQIEIANVTSSFLVLPQQDGSVSSGSVEQELNVVSHHTRARFGIAGTKSQRRSSFTERSRSVSPVTILDDTNHCDDVTGRLPCAFSGLVSSFDDLKRSLVKIEHYLETVAKANEKKKRKCITIEEWKLLSRILDRIFAVAYGLTTLLLTCYFFVQAKSGQVELAKECIYSD